MDAVVEVPPKRNNPWDRNPTYRKGKLKELELQPRDIAAVELLTRYRYLPGDYIHAFVGGSYESLQKRLGRMTREPYKYIQRAEFQKSKIDRSYRRRIYEIDRAGEILVGAERPNTHENADHELMACCAMASFELSVRDTKGFQLYSWTDILSSDTMPLATRENPQAYALRVIAKRLGQDEKPRKVIADTLPFGLLRKINGQSAYFFFPGIEADRNKDTVRTDNPKKSSLFRKIIEYSAAIDGRVFENQWGVPNLFVPILTSTQTHANSILQEINRVTDDKGSQHILVGVFPGFYFANDKPPAPYINMLTYNFQRAGYPNFNFLTS